MKLSAARFDMETSRLERPVIKNYYETVVGGSTGANTTSSYTVDVSSGNVHNLVLAVATTTFTFSNPPAWGTNGTLTLLLRQDATGGRLVVWPAEVQWVSGAPTLSTGSMNLDILTFTTFDGGATWHGMTSSMNSKVPSNVRSLWAFGSNTDGQLGNGILLSRSSPVQIGSLGDWSSLSSGISFRSLSIKTNGTLWTWGQGSFGQLGDNTTISKSSPIQVGSLTDWASTASSGGYFNLAVKTNGTLWAWGRNFFGGLGDGTVGIDRSSPVQIGALTTWARVAVGRESSFGIKTDGTLWSWGANGYGGLGDATVINKSSPTQVGVLTNWSKVFSGHYHTLAVKTDGTFWGWGRNQFGQLGDSTAINKSSPIQIGSLTTWLSADSGAEHTLSLKNDGTLWAFGKNQYGQLGDGTIINKSSPVQVGSLTTWASVSCGDQCSFAIKTDGTLWSFGRNQFGQLGDGTAINKSSPIQIGAFMSWMSVEGSRRHTMALMNR